MKLIGIGSNLTNERYASPKDVCNAALAELERLGCSVLRRSRWYESAPVPPSDQPWFVNGVAQVESDLQPGELLALLHRVESDFGRIRRERNEARVLDLDLLDYDGRVSQSGTGPELPHPRLQERAFVLRPLAEIAPQWRHPVTGKTVSELIAALPADQIARPL